MLAECFANIKSKKPAEIQKALEDRLILYVDRYRRFTYLLLSAVTSTLARYDVLENYLKTTVQRVQSDLKRLSRPLDDLKALC